LLTVKELAEEIPVQWLGRMARFNLAKVRRAMERNGRSRMRRLNGRSNQRQMARREGLARLGAGLGVTGDGESWSGLFRLSGWFRLFGLSGCPGHRTKQTKETK
jgi:hypothetical protein